MSVTPDRNLTTNQQLNAAAMKRRPYSLLLHMGGKRMERFFGWYTDALRAHRDGIATVQAPGALAREGTVTSYQVIHTESGRVIDRDAFIADLPALCEAEFAHQTSNDLEFRLEFHKGIERDPNAPAWMRKTSAASVAAIRAEIARRVAGYLAEEAEQVAA